MIERIVNKKGNKFYCVSEESIVKAQEDLGIIFPMELKEFYRKIGYGFLRSEGQNFNRIMSPNGLCEFRFRKGQFDGDTDLDIYEAYECDKLIFFEICEGNFLSIGFSKNNNGNIFYGRTKIADSLKEFLIKYQESECYFG